MSKNPLNERINPFFEALEPRQLLTAFPLIGSYYLQTGNEWDYTVSTGGTAVQRVSSGFPETEDSLVTNSGNGSDKTWEHLTSSYLWSVGSVANGITTTVKNSAPLALFPRTVYSTDNHVVYSRGQFSATDGTAAWSTTQQRDITYLGTENLAITLNGQSTTLPCVKVLVVDTKTDSRTSGTTQEQITAWFDTTSGSSLGVVKSQTVVVGSAAAPVTKTLSAFKKTPEISIENIAVVDVNCLVIPDGSDNPTTTNMTDFGSVPFASGSVSHWFKVHNYGNAPLNISGVTITGPNAADFAITSSPATSLVAANSSSIPYTTFQVKFDPTSAGLKVATISLTSSDADESPYTFTIQGTGLNSPEIAIYGNGTEILSAATMTSSFVDGTDFGTVKNGTSLTRTYTIKNLGTALLNLSTNPPVFVSSNSGFTVTKQPVSSLAPGAQTTFQIRFDAPSNSSQQFYAATVAIGSNDGDEPHYLFRVDAKAMASTPEITLYGNGHTVPDGATAASATDWTDFGSIGYSSGSLTRTFVIKNLGGSALDLVPSAGKIVITGANAADFVVMAQPTISVIAAGAQTTFQVKFDPSSAGVKTAMVSIANNDSDENPYNFTIRGTDTLLPEMTLYGNGHTIADGDTTPAITDWTDFGSVSYRSGTVTRTFTIENPGGAALNLTGSPKVVVAGVNAADFKVTLPTSPVAPGGTATFQITFDPSTAGLKKATISILSNDPDEGLYDFVIQGTGA